MKTILIFSDENDFSTNHVIDWLIYYNCNVVRINRTTKITINWIVMNNDNLNFEIEINKKIIKYTDIYSFWYRRGYIVFEQIELSEKLKKSSFFSQIKSFLNEELSDISFLLNKMLELKNGIGSFYDNDINKLWVLIKAKEIGLKIPNSHIITEKIHLPISKMKFITKGIRHGLNYTTKNYRYLTFTEDLNLKKIDSNFFPSLIQQKLIKKFELRIFYLRNKFFTQAIFSQNDPQTSTDFRKYNNSKPNRTVVFELPDDIKKMIKKLMDNCKMDSGSIDMIYTEDGDFVFLEVNPVGQFYQVSRPCNYYIEKHIAKELMNYENKKSALRI